MEIFIYVIAYIKINSGEFIMNKTIVILFLTMMLLTVSVTAWHCTDTDAAKPAAVKGVYGPWGDNAKLNGITQGWSGTNFAPDGCTGTQGNYYCKDKCVGTTLVEYYCGDRPKYSGETIIFVKSYESDDTINTNVPDITVDECSKFYDSASYYTISKWNYVINSNKCGGHYAPFERNTLYNYYNLFVEGTVNTTATWTANPIVYSVLVNGEETTGGSAGTISDTLGIDQISFCGKKPTDTTCTGSDCNQNGVPEFPGVSIAIVVAITALGLVFIRKNN